MRLKKKIVKIGMNGEENGVNISLNDRRMEEVETHRYFGVDMLTIGGMGEEVNHVIIEVKKRNMESIERLMEKEAYILKSKSWNV